MALLADCAEFELLLVCKTFCRALLAFAKIANQKLESSALASGKPATLIRELDGISCTPAAFDLGRGS
jgi:hypothetical protein